MALRERSSLTQSKFDEFLFAPIGEEGNGMTLSVMSAFARLDIDPWREAARLAELSKEMAAEALARMIARLSGGRWAPEDIDAIAARLAAFLPRGDAVGSSAAAVVGGLAKPNRRSSLLMIGVAVAVAIALFAASRDAPPGGDDAPTETSRTDSRR